MLPASLGPYRVLDRLGEGAMGVVYLGRDERSGAQVAIKVARTGESTASNLRSELRALSRLHDPRIVRVLEYGLSEDHPWYAMEFVEGETWQVYNARLWSREDVAPRASSPTLSVEDWSRDTLDGVVSVPTQALTPPPGRNKAGSGRLLEVLTLARKLCAPLGAMHGAGLVHRDLKPANVMIRRDGTPVLMDFGVVSRFRGAVGRERLEVSGSLVGTMAYMSPEQARGQRVDARADLYSLGCMLYESVTGRLPIVGATLEEMRARVIAEPPDPPSMVVDGLPVVLEELLLSLLAKDPRRRIGFADDVADVLASLGAEDDERTTTTRAYLYRPELVGRDEQVRLLEAAVRDAERGAGGIILIGGESGVGKTFLAADAARAARMRRLGVVVGECVPKVMTDATFLDHTGAPLQPLQPMLQAVADRCRNGGEAVGQRILGEHGPLLALYEPALEHAPGAAGPPPAAVPAEVMRPRLFRALREVVSAWVREVGPQLLVVDDLQWADELTMGFLASLDRAWLGGIGFLVVATWRTEETNEALRELLRDEDVRRIELQRLDAPRISAIVSDMLAMGRPPEEFLAAVTRWSEGNPFFVAEYLRTAAAEGLLVRRRGRWELVGGELSRMPAPRSVQELVTRRLAGLPEDTRQLLEVASVLGREVTLGHLLRVLGADGQTVSDATQDQLRELEGRQVLEVVDQDRWKFVHDKLRESVHAGIEPRRRKELHRAAAQAIEVGGGGRLPARVLAHHWREAEEWDRARGYLEQAGQEAAVSFSHHEVIDCFQEAVDLDGRARVPAGPRARARWDRYLGEAWLDLGNQGRGQEHVERALLDLGFRRLPLGTGRLIAAVLGQAALRVVQALVPGPFRVARPDEQQRLLDAAQLYNRLLEPKMLNNEPLLGLYCGFRNLNLAERTLPSPSLARGYGMMSAILAATPLKGLALRWADRGIGVAEAIGSSTALSYALHRGAVPYFVVGRIDEAIQRFQRAAAVAEQDGDRRRLDECRAGLAIAAQAQGRWEVCAAHARETLTSSIERGDSQTASWARALLLEVLARLGRPSEGLQGLPDLDRLGDGERTWLYAALAVSRYYADDLVGAREALTEALAVTERSSPVGYFLGAPLASLAEVATRLWARALRDGSGVAAAEATAQRTTRLLKTFALQCPFVLAYHALWTGTAAWLQGRRKAAEAGWSRAIELGTAYGMAHTVASALGERGVFLRDAGALEEAMRRMDAAGATRDRARLAASRG